MILHDTSGEYIFTILNDDKYEQVTFHDLKDIPEDFVYEYVVKFLPNIPPPPHTLQQHEQIAWFEKEFKRYLKNKLRIKRNAKRD